jgi:outer membrane lipoprotein-sorting protein
VYALEITDKGGKVSTEYYGAESHLLVAQESTEEGPQGPISVSGTISDYKEFGGIKFATKIEQKAGPQNVSITIENIEVNGKIDSKLFK